MVFAFPLDFIWRTRSFAGSFEGDGNGCAIEKDKSAAVKRVTSPASVRGVST